MNPREIKRELRRLKVAFEDVLERKELEQRLIDAWAKEREYGKEPGRRAAPLHAEVASEVAQCAALSRGALRAELRARKIQHSVWASKEELVTKLASSRLGLIDEHSEEEVRSQAHSAVAAVVDSSVDAVDSVADGLSSSERLLEGFRCVGNEAFKRTPTQVVSNSITSVTSLFDNTIAAVTDEVFGSSPESYTSEQTNAPLRGRSYLFDAARQRALRSDPQELRTALKDLGVVPAASESHETLATLFADTVLAEQSINSFANAHSPHDKRRTEHAVPHVPHTNAVPPYTTAETSTERYSHAHTQTHTPQIHVEQLDWRDDAVTDTWIGSLVDSLQLLDAPGRITAHFQRFFKQSFIRAVVDLARRGLDYTVRTLLLLASWAGRGVLRPTYVLLLCTTVCLWVRRGPMTWLGLLVVVRVLTQGFIDPDDPLPSSFPRDPFSRRISHQHTGGRIEAAAQDPSKGQTIPNTTLQQGSS